MTDGLSLNKIEEVKKKSKLSVHDRLMRLYNEEKEYKERTKKTKFEHVPAAELDREILEGKEDMESVESKRDVIDKLKEAYE